jgi:hypothetical protein
MANNDINERIAKLEVNQDHIYNGQEKIMQHLKEQSKNIRSIKQDVSELDVQIVKTKSFVGGMAFSFSILGGVIVTVAKVGLSKIGISFT